MFDGFHSIRCDVRNNLGILENMKEMKNVYSFSVHFVDNRATQSRGSYLPHYKFYNQKYLFYTREQSRFKDFHALCSTLTSTISQLN